MAVRHLGDGLDVGDVAGGVADGLQEDRGGLVVDELLQRRGAVVLGETDIDALGREHVREQGVGAAVEHRHRDDVGASLGDGDDGVVDRRLASRKCEAGDATLHLSDALLEHVGGGVHDARVDIARDLEVEEVGAVLGVIELVGDRLVDRHDDRLRGRVGLVSGVYGECLVLHGGFSCSLCVAVTEVRSMALGTVVATDAQRIIVIDAGHERLMAIVACELVHQPQPVVEECSARVPPGVVQVCVE